MKLARIILVFAGLSLLTTFSINAQSTLQISFKAINTISGYDHLSKLMVYCDGQKIGESVEKKQSQGNKIKVKVLTGTHQIFCSLWAKYDGKWEERTTANDYSFDWNYTKKMDIKKGKNTLKIIFDVEGLSVTEN
ncbi:MAG: hypothetical protein LC101_09230 [Flavobacteriales bacterium]|nr:hypothetical protein [Flavobacteriales bacterium]